MPKQLSFQTVLDVIRTLKIDVPIMRYEQDDKGAITIYLYGGEVKHWPPAAQAEITLPDPDPVPIEDQFQRKVRRGKNTPAPGPTE